MIEKYRETQQFPPFFHILMGLSSLSLVGYLIFFVVKYNSIEFFWTIVFSMFFSLDIFILLYIFLGRMIVSVNENELLVYFGFTKLVKYKIPLHEIISIEPVEFRPLMEFGGWGMRHGNFRSEKTGCLTASGNKGVLIKLLSKKKITFMFEVDKLIIGSSQPENLMLALRK